MKMTKPSCMLSEAPKRNERERERKWSLVGVLGLLQSLMDSKGGGPMGKLNFICPFLILNEKEEKFN